MNHGAHNYRYGYAVSGIGTDPVAHPGGVCWFYGAQIPDAIRASLDADWIGGFGTATGLADFPQSVSSNVQPFDASVSASSHTFKLHYTTTIASSFFISPAPSTIRLDADITAVDTDITLAGGGSTALSNDVVWIDDEAILLGVLSMGVYENCVRGIYRTTAKPHKINAVAWTVNPRRTGRLVAQLRLDLDTGIVTQRWQGILSDDPETSQNGTQLILRADEVIAAVSGGVLNRGATQIPIGGAIINADGKVRLDTGTAKRRVGKYNGTDQHQFYQVNDALVRGFSKTDYVKFQSVRPVEGSYFEDRTIEKIYEVLAISRADDALSGAFPASATSDLDYPYHPVAIAMAFLCSDDSTAIDAANYNVLGGPFGGGLPIEWFDKTAIDALIIETSHVVIDLLVLGWDGEEISPWEASKEIFRLYGFFWGRSEEGKVTVSRYREATRQDYLDAPHVPIHPPILKMRSAYSETIDTISGTLGATPWSDGIPYSVQSTSAFQDTNSVRSGFLAQARESNLDVPTKLDPFEVIEALSSIGDARHQATPRLKIRCDLGEYSHGQFIVIANPSILVDWFVDRGGVVTDIENSASFIGMVVGINESTKEPWTELEVMLTNHRMGEFVRVRGPSAVVTGIAGNDVDIELNAFTTTGDGLEFAIGDKVELHDSRGSRSGAVGTEVRTIAVKTDDKLTLDFPFTTVPVAGDVLRLAHFGPAGTLAENCPYVFMGAGDDTIGAAKEPAHRYGLGVL